MADADKKYLLIAHKPDSADYCRGSLRERYEGALVCETHPSLAAVEDRLVELCATPLGYAESGYEIAGVYELAGDGEDMQYEGENGTLEWRVSQRAKALSATRQAEAERLAAEKRRADDEAKRAAREKAERTHYERLKEKYEGSPTPAGLPTSSEDSRHG